MTEEDAKQEGYDSKDEYLDEFRTIYPDAPVNPLVFVVEFEYVGMERI